MHGNVAEWVLDQYDEDGYSHVKEGDSVTVDQAFRRPKKVFPRVARGGSFDDSPEECRSSSRLASEKAWKSEDCNFPQSPWWLTDAPGVGFRLLRPLAVPATDQAKDAFWKHDVDSILDNAKHRISTQGKGAYGIVDENFPNDAAAALERAAKEDKNRK